VALWDRLSSFLVFILAIKRKLFQIEFASSFGHGNYTKYKPDHHRDGVDSSSSAIVMMMTMIWHLCCRSS